MIVSSCERCGRKEWPVNPLPKDQTLGVVVKTADELFATISWD